MAIRLPFSKLSSWQHIALSCALLERMLPNYKMFSDAADFGDAQLLRNQLNLLWQTLDRTQKVRVNAEAQTTKLEEHIPNPDNYDFFGVYPALDCAMAMLSLLQGVGSKDTDEIANVSRLSENSVRYFVELTLAQEKEAGDEISVQEINQHPLMEWEIATQNELFDFLKQAPENKKTCQTIKNMVLEEGLSNLGIEI